MRKIFTKEILACLAFFNVKFIGVLKFAGTVKIGRFDIFSRCKSREDEYCISYGSTVKLSVRRRLYAVYVRYVKHVASVICNKWGDRIQNSKVLDILRDC